MLERPTGDAARRLAGATSRRSFLGRLGQGFIALVGGPLVATALTAERAEAFHLCGHIYTTGSCPHPFFPKTRVDRHGYPVHPKYGYPVDNKGNIYRSRGQRRDKICKVVVPRKYPESGDVKAGGGWSRCCKGHVRRIVDCCSYSKTRINGDASLVGYCHNGRRVFCITYRDTNVKC